MEAPILMETIQRLSVVLGGLFTLFDMMDQLQEQGEGDHLFHTVQTLERLIFLLQALVQVLALPEEEEFETILRTLFPDFHGHRNNPQDFWLELEMRPHLFWYMSGFTPNSLQTLVDRIELYVREPRNVRGDFPPDAIREPRECGLTPRNRVLMVVIWMRQYPTLANLALLFGIDKTTASDDIHHILPILRYALQDEIVWPTEQELNHFRESWANFPTSVLALDCTIHPIWKPLINPGEYYRGDKKEYCFLSLAICDPLGKIRHFESGYRGTNDTQVYNLSQFAQGNLPIPDWARVLVDGGFPDRNPLVPPYRETEVFMDPELSEVNVWHRFYRSEVERAMKRLKVYKCTSAVWRHPKSFQPQVAYTAACLANRKLEEETQARELFEN